MLPSDYRVNTKELLLRVLSVEFRLKPWFFWVLTLQSLVAALKSPKKSLLKFLNSAPVLKLLALEELM